MIAICLTILAITINCTQATDAKIKLPSIPRLNFNDVNQVTSAPSNIRGRKRKYVDAQSFDEFGRDTDDEFAGCEGNDHEQQLSTQTQGNVSNSESFAPKSDVFESRASQQNPRRISGQLELYRHEMLQSLTAYAANQHREPTHAPHQLN